MKKWIVVILCIMAFSVGYANTDKDTSETSETDKKTERIIAEQKTREEKERKTCEVCGHYGNDVISNSALDDERKMCRDCMSKAREKQRKTDKEAKNKEEQKEQQEKEERAIIAYEDNNIIIKVRAEDMKKFIWPRAEGDFYVKIVTEVINKGNKTASVTFPSESIMINNTDSNGDNYNIIDTQISALSDYHTEEYIYVTRNINGQDCSHYDKYIEYTKELETNESFEFERLIVGSKDNIESKILFNINSVTFNFRVNDSELKKVTVNNISYNNNSEIEEKITNKEQEEKEAIATQEKIARAKARRDEADRKARIRQSDTNNNKQNNNDYNDNNANTTNNSKEIEYVQDNNIKQAYNNLPTSVKQLFKDINCEIKEVNVVSIPGAVGAFSAGGSYGHPTIEIRKNNKYITYTVYHEFGHMLDYGYNYKYESKENEFYNIYLDERAEFRTDYNYQYAISEVEEYFASSFAEYIINPQRLKSNTPRTYNYIVNTINNIE